MIDIEKLRLTEEDINKLFAGHCDIDGDTSLDVPGMAANAQLAKALWGLVEQFYNYPDERTGESHVAAAMRLMEKLDAWKIEPPPVMEYECDNDDCRGPALIDRCLKCGYNSVSPVIEAAGVPRPEN